MVAAAVRDASAAWAAFVTGGELTDDRILREELAALRVQAHCFTGTEQGRCEEDGSPSTPLSHLSIREAVRAF